jgi:3-methyladenine DNA glycosylase AlkD
MIKQIEKEFEQYCSEKSARQNSRFFKTGKGEYSEGDLFIDITNPEVHKIANKYKKEISLEHTLHFLRHKIHEYRLFALDVLKYKYSKANGDEKKEIVDLYLNNRKFVNNWDLVDVSAPHILGDWLIEKDRKVLYKLVKEENLWSNRIAILSTLAFIKENDFEDTLKLSEALLNHEHDLIHKAVGWMLREIWKRDKKVTESFLIDHYENVPRTALRYAIEKMEETKRKKFLKGAFQNN